VTIGNAKIIADQRANAIIVLGNREVVVKVAKILDEMDVSSPQVALSTVIGELTLTNDEEFGIDYFARNRGIRPGGALTSRNTGVPAPPTTLNGGAILNPANLLNFTETANQAFGALSGTTNIYLGAANSLGAIVHLLYQTGRFRTISRPTIFTSNNKKAIIASGQEIPVPVNTIGTINQLGTQQSSIQFKKIALQLEVVPLINSEKEVTLDILQKLDSKAADVNISGNLIPTIATKYVKTTVSAPNCATIVLGGLIAEDTSRTANGIPILSKIPLIGALFRNTDKSKSRRELIILMRPEVSLTKLDLYRLRQKNEDKTHLGPELEQDDCPDCPKPGDGKQFDLPAPDLPGMK
jgi:general secretion pathway protein D